MLVTLPEILSGFSLSIFGVNGMKTMMVITAMQLDTLRQGSVCTMTCKMVPFPKNLSKGTKVQ